MKTPVKTAGLCAAIFITSLLLGTVIFQSPAKHKDQVPEFMAVGKVFNYKPKTEGGAKLSFEHPNGEVERMDFCPSGTVELLDSRYEVTWAIWYKGTPGEGCYNVD